MIPMLSARPYLKILLRVPLVRDPEVVPVEAVLIPVTDDQGCLAGVSVQGDVVGDEAVAQGVLGRALRLEVERWKSLAVALFILTGDVIRLDE